MWLDVLLPPMLVLQLCIRYIDAEYYSTLEDALYSIVPETEKLHAENILTVKHAVLYSNITWQANGTLFVIEKEQDYYRLNSESVMVTDGFPQSKIKCHTYQSSVFIWTNETHLSTVKIDAVDFHGLQVEFHSMICRYDKLYLTVVLSWAGSEEIVNAVRSRRVLCLTPARTLCSVNNSTSLRIEGVRKTAALKTLAVKFLDLRRKCQVYLPDITVPERFSDAQCRDKPMPCVRPGLVRNVTWSKMDENIQLTWQAPRKNEMSDEVEAYAIRWGIYHQADDMLEGSLFILNETKEINWMPANNSQDILHFNISHTDSWSWKLSHPVQVVAVCEDGFKVLKLIDKTTPPFNDSLQEVLKLSVFSPQVNTIIVPAESTVEEDYDRSVGEEVIMPYIPTTITYNEHRKTGSKKKSGNESSLLPITLTLCGVFVCCVALVYTKHIVRKYRMSSTARKHHSAMNANDLYHTLGRENVYEVDEWEISPRNLEWDGMLGTGAFGQVFKCKLSKEDNFEFKPKLTVAVKIMSDTEDNQEKMKFYEELKVMKSLSPHPNILPLIGCVTLHEPICIVLKYAENGDLLTYLRSSRSSDKVSTDDDYVNTNRVVELSQILKLGLDIASGMEVISDKGYVHRDLAARNVLLDADGVAMIADFGLTRFMNTDDVYVLKQNKRLPVKWLSIEALTHLIFSPASDVWAFGIVLFELVTLGDTPYPAIQPADIVDYLKAGKRLEKPESCTEQMYELMLQCWRDDPKARPTFSELRVKLSQLLGARNAIDSVQQSFALEDMKITQPAGDITSMRSPLTSESTIGDLSMLTDTTSVCSSTSSVNEWTVAREGTSGDDLLYQPGFVNAKPELDFLQLENHIEVQDGRNTTNSNCLPDPLMNSDNQHDLNYKKMTVDQNASLLQMEMQGYGTCDPTSLPLNNTFNNLTGQTL